MSVCVAQESSLGGESEQRLQHHQGDQLGVSEPRSEPDARPPRSILRIVGEKIISRHVQSGSEGVQVGVHFGLQCQVGLSNANPGHPHP